MAMVHAQFSSPLMVAGDFNVIFKVDERSGGASPNPRNMEEFNEAIFQCNLSEVSFDGSSFTWTNGKVWQQLDQALVNVDWARLFDCTKVSHLLRERSDHGPLLIKYGNPRNRVVREAWWVPVPVGGMAGFFWKLMNTKRKLREWNVQVFGNIFSAVKDAEKVLLLTAAEYDQYCDEKSRTRVAEAKADHA
ncbi:uncharacterized protein [Coffea arabica]|uniref:Uncharacterized protein n=1 Tax=Coffea arabica TaxID=13443 RepID=A0ABM4U618_COFAR